MENINVILMDNPHGVKGSVNKNRDGTYTIIINAALNREQQLEAYQHELMHIENGDFEKDYSADKIEFETHNVPAQKTTGVRQKYPKACGYLDHVKKKRHRKISRTSELDDFNNKYYDVFRTAENQYLYGND